VRVLLDTSVLVAALATRGLCADVLRTVLAGHELIVGETVLTELAKVLRDKLGMPEAQARDVVGFIRQQAFVAAESAVPAVDPRDATDLPILAAAVAGTADALVTGDKDLLVLERVEAVPILNPRAFWEVAKRR
jgi:uncharacterized protein